MDKTPYDEARALAYDAFRNLDLSEPRHPGFPMELPPDCPIELVENEPVLPVSLTEISSQHLGIVYAVFNAFYKYVLHQATVASIDKTTEAKKLKLLKLRVELEYSDLLKKDIPDAVLRDERVIEQEGIFDSADYLSRLLEAKVTMYSKDLQLISRELTRRLGDIEVERREHSFDRNY